MSTSIQILSGTVALQKHLVTPPPPGLPRLTPLGTHYVPMLHCPLLDRVFGRLEVRIFGTVWLRGAICKRRVWVLIEWWYWPERANRIIGCNRDKSTIWLLALGDIVHCNLIFCQIWIGASSSSRSLRCHPWYTMLSRTKVTMSCGACVRLKNESQHEARCIRWGLERPISERG